jgi:hypothetical protein
MTSSLGRKSVLFLVLVLAASSLSAVIPNWAAPATWSPPKSHSGLTTQDLSNPLPFIPLAPCRIVDTRGNGAPITGGIFTGGADVRTYDVTGICGIPSSAHALSLNFTVTGPGQTVPGFLLAWPAGGAIPPVSILNWDSVPQQIANAAVVPTNFTQAFTVNVSGPTHVIIDVNGFYYDGNLGGTSYLATGEQFVLAGDFAGATILYGENKNSAATSRGIRGVASATTGQVYGVWGDSNSAGTRAAGVLGTDGVGVVNETAGFSFSSGLIAQGRNGIVGMTSTPAGFGVAGTAENSAGTITSQGRLGQGGFAFLANGGDISCAGCTKFFIDPHPSDPTKEIRFASLEGNEAGTYFRGTAQTIDREFVIQVPEEFRFVSDTEGLTVQLTPVGAPASMYVVSEDLNVIVVRSSRDVKFHYLVQGIHAPHKDLKSIHDMEIYMPDGPDSRMPEAFPALVKQWLIANGTYNPDGSVNMQTAERVGWAQRWRDTEEAVRAQAASKRARADIY